MLSWSAVYDICYILMSLDSRDREGKEGGGSGRVGGEKREMFRAGEMMKGGGEAWGRTEDWETNREYEGKGTV